jgi:hypothetical protein
MVEDVLVTALILPILIFIFWVVGGVLTCLFGKSFCNVETVFLGLLLVLSCWVVWIKDFKTVFAPTLLLVVFYFKPNNLNYKLFAEKFHVKFKFDLFFILFSTWIIAVFPFVNFSNLTLNIPHDDLLFYSRLAKQLLVFGRENLSFTSDSFNDYNGVAPYHYFDLYFAALISSITGIGTYYCLYFLAIPFILFLITWYLYNTMISMNHGRLKSSFIALMCIFFGAHSTLLCEFLPFQRNIIHLFEYNQMTGLFGRKLLIIYFLSLLGLKSLHAGNYEKGLFFLIVLSILYTTTLIAICSFVLVSLVLNYHREKLFLFTRWQFLVLIIAYCIVVLIFYLFPQRLYHLGAADTGFLQTPLNLRFKGVFASLVYAFTSILIPVLISIYYRKQMLINRSELILSSSIFFVSALQVFFFIPSLDSFQFVSNIVPFFLSYFLVKFLQIINLKKYEFHLLIFTIYLIFSANFQRKIYKWSMMDFDKRYYNLNLGELKMRLNLQCCNKNDYVGYRRKIFKDELYIYNKPLHKQFAALDFLGFDKYIEIPNDSSVLTFVKKHKIKLIIFDSDSYINFNEFDQDKIEFIKLGKENLVLIK